MKKTNILLLSISLLLAACNQKDNSTPGDLESKKELLKEKKAELNTLQLEIKELKEEISILDPEAAKKQILVTVDTINKAVFKQYVEVQAMVAAEDYVNASSETGGRILQLHVQEGDYIKKGKLVATIDLESLKKQLEEVETAFELANTVFERQKRLWEQNIGSELQYLEAKNNKERLEKSMATLKTNLDKKYVYAPISGFVDREFVQSGEMSSPGMPIVSILNTSKVKVVADLPENYLTAVKMGDFVEVTYPALNKTTTSRITMLGRSIDPSNRTIKVEIKADNSSGKLKPNLLAKVKLNNYTNDSAIAVSSDLVLKDVTGNQFVYIVKNEGDKKLAKQIYVETGESYDNKIEIKAGLNPNDLIIVDGARSLSDGTEIKF